MLSQNLSVNEKLNIIGNEYDIPMGEDFREDVSVMCNLSQKIKETGIETGIEIGKKEMIVKMHSKGYTTAQIADVAGMEEKKIEEIIKNEELLPAQCSVKEKPFKWMFIWMAFYPFTDKRRTAFP